MKNKTKYVTPKTPSKGYAFVAAGASYKNGGGITVYVKYCRNAPHKIEVKQITDSYVWFVCPDRELVLVRDGQTLGAFYPYGDSFDECYDFNAFNDRAGKGLGLKYIMTNYVHNPHSKNCRLGSEVPEESRLTILSDSGGLQLVRRLGSQMIIDPRDLMNYYNNNVDAGMVLDIPLAIVDRKTTARAARLQKRNNELMLSMSKGTELINIFHGHTDDERARYREIVENDAIPRVALGGVPFNSLMSGVDLLYSSINSGFRYKQYHVLGAFGAAHLPLLVKIANTGANPVHITSDSTSHIQSAVNKAYHFQFDINTTSKRLPIGARATGPNSNRLLPCQCAVCRVIKYTDVLGFGDGRHTTELLAMHNALEMTRYTDQLQEACENLTSKDYNKLVQEQMGKNPARTEFTHCLEFIEIAAENHEKARTKYSSMINKRKASRTAVAPGNKLFGESVPDIAIKRQEHVLSLMDRMENLLDSLGA